MIILLSINLIIIMCITVAALHRRKVYYTDPNWWSVVLGISLSFLNGVVFHMNL